MILSILFYLIRFEMMPTLLSLLLPPLAPPSMVSSWNLLPLLLRIKMKSTVVNGMLNTSSSCNFNKNAKFKCENTWWENNRYTIQNTRNTMCVTVFWPRIDAPQKAMYPLVVTIYISDCDCRYIAFFVIVVIVVVVGECLFLL